MTDSRRIVETKLWDIGSAIGRRFVTPRTADWHTSRLVGRLSRFEDGLQRDKAANPAHLHWFEASRYSQNGEDGIIAEIFRRIGTRSRFFVEIGAADGAENCTAALVDEDWQGVWVEGDPEKAAAARRLVGSRGVEVCHAFVDRETILPLLDAANIPQEVDLLVLDLDGNDYWILERIGTRLRPRVMVLEYNAVIGPWFRWTMPYDAKHRWDGTLRHGASLAALASLGSRLGFTLIGCDSRGINAFFVRAEEAGPFDPGSARWHWVPPRYRLPYGHPKHLPAPFDAPPIPESEVGLVTLSLVAPPPRAIHPGGLIYFKARITNGSTVSIGESLPTPTRLVAWWLDREGTKLADAEQRSMQPWRADPGSSSLLVGQVQAPPSVGTYTLEVGLVQDNVRWMTEANRRVGAWQVTHSLDVT